MQTTELEELNLDEDFGQNVVDQSSYYTIEEKEHFGIANDFTQTVLLPDPYDLEIKGSIYSSTENPSNYSEPEVKKGLESDIPIDSWNSQQIGLALTSQTKGKLSTYSSPLMPHPSPLDD